MSKKLQIGVTKKLVASIEANIEALEAGTQDIQVARELTRAANAVLKSYIVELEVEKMRRKHGN
jgi:hypothetical protein